MTTMNRFLILPSLLALALAAGAQSQNESIRTLTAEALHQRLEAKSNLPLVVDVREPSEFEGAFRTIAARNADAVVVSADALLTANSAAIASRPASSR